MVTMEYHKRFKIESKELTATLSDMDTDSAIKHFESIINALFDSGRRLDYTHAYYLFDGISDYCQSLGWTDRRRSWDHYQELGLRYRLTRY